MFLFNTFILYLRQIVFQMFLFNTFILYLRQNIKNEHSFVENPTTVPHIYVKQPLPPSPEFGL